MEPSRSESFSYRQPADTYAGYTCRFSRRRQKGKQRPRNRKRRLFKTKAEAEAYAKQVAANQGTTVVRQKKDGKIQKK